MWDNWRGAWLDKQSRVFCFANPFAFIHSFGQVSLSVSPQTTPLCYNALMEHLLRCQLWPSLLLVALFFTLQPTDSLSWLSSYTASTAYILIYHIFLILWKWVFKMHSLRCDAHIKTISCSLVMYLWCTHMLFWFLWEHLSCYFSHVNLTPQWFIFYYQYKDHMPENISDSLNSL